LRFVIGLVVIGAALAIAARVVIGGAPQPATEEADRDRELPRMRFDRRPPPVQVVNPERVTPTSWWVRARAVVLLSAILALLGAFLALLLVLGGALVVTGLRNAVQ
jgi:heme O synthase-like polyprenyltransferase